MADLLVTGTDTGVGKTAVAAGLVLALRAAGRRAIGFKPAESGVSADEVTDSALLARASGVEEALARPLLSLAEPLAPAMAALRAGVALDPAEVEARVRALREKLYEPVVIEGAGGVAAPLTWGYTVLDLARHLGLQAVVVARPGLGTLNHAWLTVEALSARAIPVAAVILNGVPAAPDLAEQTNQEALGRLLPHVRVISLPRVGSGDSWQVANQLAAHLAAADFIK